MPVEHSYPRNMMVQNFQLPFFHTLFWKHKEKLSTTEQEAYGVYYAITKGNHYLQGVDIIVRNDHKPLTKFVNGKNANNKVKRWGLELAMYNIILNGFLELTVKQQIPFMPSGFTSDHTSISQLVIHHKLRWTHL